MNAAALLAGHRPVDPGPIWERTADVVAVFAAALRTREGGILNNLWSDTGADGAVAGRAAAVRYSECDPIHVPSCMTADAVAVPVALAAANSAELFLKAVSIGGAVGVRLARAVGGVAALAAGIWPALFAAPAVAAVTDAVARGRSSDEIECALSLALAGISGRAGRPGGMPSGRWTSFGDAVFKGLRAARAAEAGAQGDATLIGPDWLSMQAGALADPSALAGDARDNAVGLKTVVAARQGLTAVAAFQDMLSEGLNPAQIVRLRVFLPTSCVSVVTRPMVAGVRLSEIADLAVALGIAAHAPARLLDIGREDTLSPDVLAFAGRVEIEADPALEAAPDGAWPAVLHAQTADGSRTQRRDFAPADPGVPGRRAALEHKLSVLKVGAASEALAFSRDGNAEEILARFRAACPG